MLVLIGCEESQTVCKAFRDKGHGAYSCDIIETRGNPQWHIKGDVFDAIKSRHWNLIILHPPCTCLSVSGNRWYGKGTPGFCRRIESIDWTVQLWELAKSHADRVCLENPVSVIWSHIPRTQYIQPFMFGHGETKKTGLALHNLLPLIPTNLVSGREQKVWKMGPSPTRKRDRSKTYQGIADAMAEQWALLD